MKILAVVNHKGGVGKTTSAVNIASYFALSGKKVLLIDLDPQAHASDHLGIRAFEQGSTFEFLLEEDVCPIFQFSRIPTLSIIPSSLELAKAEVMLYSKAVGREHRLKKMIEKKITDDYSYIFIDCPPNLGILTLNALSTAHMLLIPIQAEYLALEGIAGLWEVLEELREFDRVPRILGVFLTMFSKRNIICREIAEAVKNYFKDMLFETKIRRNVSLAEAPSHHLPIFLYAPKSYGAVDYRNLSEEIARRIEKLEKEGSEK